MLIGTYDRLLHLSKTYLTGDRKRKAYGSLLNRWCCCHDLFGVTVKVLVNLYHSLRSTASNVVSHVFLPLYYCS